MSQRIVLALALVATAGHAALTRLTEPAIRAFVANQEAAWNARDAHAWAGFFTPDARFVDQSRGSDNSIVPNGTSTLAQAATQAERFFARSAFHETSEVTRIEIAPDGRAARVWTYEKIRIDQPGRASRIHCTESEARLVLAAGRILSRGQTDTAVRCNAAR